MHRRLMDWIESLGILLCQLLDPNEAHRWPADRFPNTSGIRHVMRIRLDIRFSTPGASTFPQAQVHESAVPSPARLHRPPFR
jgi:hypothetical protein